MQRRERINTHTTHTIENQQTTLMARRHGDRETRRDNSNTQHRDTTLRHDSNTQHCDTTLRRGDKETRRDNKESTHTVENESKKDLALPAAQATAALADGGRETLGKALQHRVELRLRGRRPHLV